MSSEQGQEYMAVQDSKKYQILFEEAENSAKLSFEALSVNKELEMESKLK